MSELRQDPITRDWVILAPERGERPQERGSERPVCPFCPGNEHLTPAELERVEDGDGGWRVRVVANRYATLRADAGVETGRERVPEGWHRQLGYGHHEVIIESPAHSASLGTLPVEQTRQVLAMYSRRFRALAGGDGRVRQVVLFRNQGVHAGTSLAHPHAQIVATPVVSPVIRRRMADEVAFFDANGVCGLCHVLARERETGTRVVLESARFATVAPYASRASYHLQVVPRTHGASFGEVTEEELDDLARHLRQVLGALQRRLGEPHYNLVVFTPPLDQVHRHANHWFIDIVPRLTTPAGFELGSRIVVNVQTPERAAAELRAEVQKG